MSEGVATSDIRAVHREVLMLLGAGVIVIVALIYGLYRSVARPIERLSATVRATVPGNVVEATVDGPAEVVGLSRDFAALTQDVARQMSRREQAEQDVVESEQRYRRLFAGSPRSEEHTSELQSLMRISYAVFCLKKKKMIQLHK